MFILSSRIGFVEAPVYVVSLKFAVIVLLQTNTQSWIPLEWNKKYFV